MRAYTANSSSESSESEQDDFLYSAADPRADEFADYNPRKRRRTGRDPEESAALGIFGSESEDEGPGKRWKTSNIRKKGMAFVKSGETVGVDEDDEDEDEEVEEEPVGIVQSGNAQEDEDMNIDDDKDGYIEEDAQPRLGLGAPKAGRLGFGSNNFTTERDRKSVV